jgi:membrane-associated protein
MTFLLDAFNWTQLLQPQFYIDNGGLWLVLLIIFAETGLFAGFFLPGDSLLFVSGIYSTSLAASFYDTGNDLMNLVMIIALTSLAGILGNTVGFWFGRRIGPAMYTWRDRLLFKQRYLHQAKEFYDKHGGGAIVFARFLPVIRTFAPIIAGIVYMDRKKFAFYNIVGSIAWTASMLAGGHYLQKFFEANFNYDLKEHLEVIVLGIVLLTTAPVLYKLFFGKKKDPAEPLNSSE